MQRAERLRPELAGHPAKEFAGHFAEAAKHSALKAEHSAWKAEHPTGEAGHPAKLNPFLNFVTAKLKPFLNSVTAKLEAAKREALNRPI